VASFEKQGFFWYNGAVFREAERLPAYDNNQRREESPDSIEHGIRRNAETGNR